MKTKLIMAVALALMVSACASASPVPPPNALVAGFWQGLWHGLILPFAFVASLFNPHYGLYETLHSSWYNAGFMLGVGTYIAISRA